MLETIAKRMDAPFQLSVVECRLYVTRRQFRRGLGPGRFGEWRDVNRLVSDGQDLQGLRAARRVEDHGVPGAGLHQCARQRRDPADMVAIEIDLVDADDAD